MSFETLKANIRLNFRLSLLVMAVFILGSSSICSMAFAAKSKPVGLGIILGEPSGITGKYWFTDLVAMDLTASYSFVHYWLIYGDGLYHFRDVIKLPSDFSGTLVPYVGGGAGIRFSTRDRKDELSAYLRVPLGIEFLFRKPSLALFVELASGLGIAPSTFGVVNGGVGVRYFF